MQLIMVIIYIWKIQSSHSGIHSSPQNPAQRRRLIHAIPLLQIKVPGKSQASICYREPSLWKLNTMVLSTDYRPPS
jgi:hypothetical protein